MHSKSKSQTYTCKTKNNCRAILNAILLSSTDERKIPILSLTSIILKNLRTTVERDKKQMNDKVIILYTVLFQEITVLTYRHT